MASKTKKKKQSGDKRLPEQIVAHLRARELGRRHYAKADRLLDEITRLIKPGEEIALRGGKKAVLKDQFAHTNKVFRSHGIARFEIQVIES